MQKGRLLMSFLAFKNNRHLVTAVRPVLLSAASLAFFLAAFTSLKFALTGPMNDRLPAFDGYSRDCDTPDVGVSKPSAITYPLANAILHFATTTEIPQQSREEINVTLQILQKRSPCNFLVFGLWHDSLMWGVLNYGGRTVFLDESQEWIDRTKAKHPQLETYKIDYHTTLGEASSLLQNAKSSNFSVNCLPYQPIAFSSCPLSLSHVLPKELLTVEWDVILIDGPRSYNNLSFPGRMSAIFSAGVMARTRTAPGSVDVLLHDVSRSVEKQYGEEFLCFSNLVFSVHELWHFSISPSNSSSFCPSLSLQSKTGKS